MKYSTVIISLVFFICSNTINATPIDTVMVDSASCFKNGNIKLIVNTFCNKEGNEYKTAIEEWICYHKNGKIRSVRRTHYNSDYKEYMATMEEYDKKGFKTKVAIYQDDHVLYDAKYSNNQLYYERTYVYNNYGLLIGIETNNGGNHSYQNFDVYDTDKKEACDAGFK